MPKLVEPQRSRPTRGAFDVSGVDKALKVIPTDGCHRCVRRERLLCEISSGRLTSPRTCWVPNLTKATPNERLPRIEPRQDAQADGVPTEAGGGTFRREVPLGLLGRVALADEGPDCLVDD